MTDYLKAFIRVKALHARKREKSNTPQPFSVDQAHEMASSGDWGPLHDYMLDHAYQHYQDQSQAEDYVRQHHTFLSEDPQSYMPDELDYFAAGLGTRVSPASSLTPGQHIKLPAHFEHGRTDDWHEVHQVSPLSVGGDDRFTAIRARNLRTGDFSDLQMWHTRPISYRDAGDAP